MARYTNTQLRIRQRAARELSVVSVVHKKRVTYRPVNFLWRLHVRRDVQGLPVPVVRWTVK